MVLNLISLATIKAQLGITASTYDTALTALIPIVSGDVRRILNNQFDKYILCSFDSSSTSISIVETARTYVDGLGQINAPSIDLGCVVYNPNLPADTYLTVHSPTTGFHTLSATPTGVGDYIFPTINVSQFPTIAKMIWYKYSKQNTASAGARGVSSESYGSVSVSYSEREINKRFDYPQQLIDDLGIPFARIG
jgi:hypothetical protein